MKLNNGKSNAELYIYNWKGKIAILSCDNER